MKLAFVFFGLISGCYSNAPDPNVMHSSLAPAQDTIASTVNDRRTSELLFDTCDFSFGDWIFYIVEDTNLTNQHYLTDTYGSPALILDNETKMQSIKSSWRIACTESDAGTCFAYLTVLHNGNAVWFTSICLTPSEEILQSSATGLCYFEPPGVLRESLHEFEKCSVFPSVPQRPVTLNQLTAGQRPTKR